VVWDAITTDLPHLVTSVEGLLAELDAQERLVRAETRASRAIPWNVP
jgi:hypothetical protein